MQPILLKKSSISSRLLNCILGGILQRSAKLSAMGCTYLLIKLHFRRGISRLGILIRQGHTLCISLSELKLHNAEITA
jgi:hypothetical protein